MKAYVDFDSWLKNQCAANKKLISALRNLVNRTSKSLVETVKWGNGCWTKDDMPVIYIYCAKNYVQLGFFGGSLLPDPKKILKGSGKFIRHIKIERVEEIQKTAFTKLIQQAIKTKYK